MYVLMYVRIRMYVYIYVCIVYELLYSKDLTYMHFHNVTIIAHCAVYQPLLSTTIIVNNHVMYTGVLTCLCEEILLSINITYGQSNCGQSMNTITITAAVCCWYFIYIICNNKCVLHSSRPHRLRNLLTTALRFFAYPLTHLWLDLLRQSTVVLSPQGVPQYHKYHTTPLTVPFLKLMGMTIWTVGLQTRLVAVPFRS